MHTQANDPANYSTYYRRPSNMPCNDHQRKHWPAMIIKQFHLTVRHSLQVDLGSGVAPPASAPYRDIHHVVSSGNDQRHCDTLSSRRILPLAVLKRDLADLGIDPRVFKADCDLIDSNASNHKAAYSRSTHHTNRPCRSCHNAALARHPASHAKSVLRNPHVAKQSIPPTTSPRHLLNAVKQSTASRPVGSTLLIGVDRQYSYSDDPLAAPSGSRCTHVPITGCSTRCRTWHNPVAAS
jgi:hypothetical protein